jgi:hypothetical protein
MAQSIEGQRKGGTFLGFPLGGFGVLTTLLLILATGFFTFFLATCLAIFALLGWNVVGGHAVNYAYTYLYVGLPAGLLALVTAAVVFAVLWVRAKTK